MISEIKSSIQSLMPSRLMVLLTGKQGDLEHEDDGGGQLSVTPAAAVEASRSALPLVSVRGVTKSFPGVVANDHIDLDLFRGEVHALLGENGAGKSTLMKILYGIYRQDSGEVLIEGDPVNIKSPNDARHLKIGMVFQQFSLISRLTVAENVALFLPHLNIIIDKQEISRRITEASEEYGLSIDPTALIWRLSIGEQQRVEVIKLLLAGARLLIFDEPTSVLAPHEIEGLFEIFRRLRSEGFAVVFITHKLPEAMESADRITILRRGAVAATLLKDEATEDSLIEFMFGTAPPQLDRSKSTLETRDKQLVLELRGIYSGNPNTASGLKEIDLAIYPGEIVGVAGVSGNGQRALGEVILGLQPSFKGSKLLSGEDSTDWSTAKIRSQGVSYVPEDPLSMGSVPSMTVEENLALTHSSRYFRHKGLTIDWDAVAKEMPAEMEASGLRLPPMKTTMATLSGGNMQRVVLARELAFHPTLLVLAYPTKGLDVPSAVTARKLMVAARDEGAGVLLISDDLGELFLLSDRILVLHQGRIVGSFKPEETTMTEVGYLMTGAEGRDG